MQTERSSLHEQLGFGREQNAVLQNELESTKASLDSVREELDRKEKKAERDIEEIKTANKDKDHRFNPC